MRRPAPDGRSEAASVEAGDGAVEDRSHLPIASAPSAVSFQPGPVPPGMSGRPAKQPRTRAGQDPRRHHRAPPGPHPKSLRGTSRPRQLHVVDPKSSRTATFHSGIKRLRTALGETGRSRLTTCGTGYLLSAAEDDVDVARFRHRADAGLAEARAESWETRHRACEQRSHCGAARPWPTFRRNCSPKLMAGPWKKCDCRCSRRELRQTCDSVTTVRSFLSFNYLYLLISCANDPMRCSSAPSTVPGSARPPSPPTERCATTWSPN
jgi:hypothetical protein